MTDPNLSPLQSLWLHTLVANRDKLGDMKPYWTDVELVSKPHQTHLIESYWRDNKLRIHVAFDGESYARIEQQEIMQAVLAWTHIQLARYEVVVLSRELAVLSFDDAAHFLRACPTNDARPDVRWRKLQMFSYRHELPYQTLEDRPVCMICHARVATGAGLIYDETEYDTAISTRVTRHDVHRECYRYAKLVMVPALKAQRQAAAQKATAGVDK